MLSETVILLQRPLHLSKQLLHLTGRFLEIYKMLIVYHLSIFPFQLMSREHGKWLQLIYAAFFLKLIITEVAIAPNSKIQEANEIFSPK